MTSGFRSAGRSDPGAVRRRNEDNLVERQDIGVWAVADGAGGHAAGDVASGLVRQALLAIPAGLGAQELLGEVRARLAQVHEMLLARAEAPGGATSATTVVVLIAGEGHFACLWAGDSRLYRLRDGALSLITRDHSLVQEMVDAGTLTPEAAEGHPHSNVVTRALGVGDLALEKVTDRLEPNDRFLLCSDGLSKAVPEVEIAALLAAESPETVVDGLMAAALARGARDNVTAVAVGA
ncbi:PP2C family protein-serine/threonine phosphatase [Paracraurococcus lichenis]|uniref:Protein phosphatase 2C domain-containing protein n=1 Tax=Paracraurococcus lichenis TaxID=3064888 RepID=A0ABT9DYC2_9PROT|nr:protein phosphatase 2C domain-containing protein [Paracraurococcus sp. LOR1-02]MDO9708750.1 protein phosphatase 2C domain-containing protein [Paracraurococcus sp. LOR1-02]